MQSTSECAADLTVAELKEKLRSIGLKTTGKRNELVCRLLNADSSETCVREESEIQEILQETSKATSETNIPERSRDDTLMKRMDEFEKLIQVITVGIASMRQEFGNIQLAQSATKETEMLTRNKRADKKQVSRTQKTWNVSAIADYLAEFTGEFDGYDRWEKQLKLLKETYQLDEEETKRLAILKLKGKALEWFHSKPDHVAMSIDMLLQELESMYRHYPNTIVMRKKFESRVWNTTETFNEYAHDKVIMANKLSISEYELVQYLIEGIPDPNLRNQARLHKFKTRAEISEAFEDIMLRGPTISRGVRSSGDNIAVSSSRIRRDKEENYVVNR
ncbi:hypothetical protein WN51_01115 [Melipona quadrifasciata]|uniref:SAP domain-containing protein n=1 Tax=Melipona quadrifasciata TaxID=166423 RepID=A0A0N0BGH1_9HYME|nr:hypothetical protein WN51_01115 [Melipona quadrifasciata]